MTREEQILVGILVDVADFATREPDWTYGDRRAAWERLAIEDAKSGLVKPDHAKWTNNPVPSNSDHVLNSRALANLERKGLLERHRLNYGNQTSHVSLTDAGRAAAERLLDTQRKRERRIEEGLTPVLPEAES